MIITTNNEYVLYSVLYFILLSLSHLILTHLNEILYFPFHFKVPGAVLGT